MRCRTLKCGPLLPDATTTVPPRYQSGTGQERGGITTELRNSGTSPLTVVHLEVVPWYLRLFLHTLQVGEVCGLVCSG